MMQHRSYNLQTARALSREAADARILATGFTEPQTVTDLQNFAAALERSAYELRHPHAAAPATPMQRRKRA
jgi:hypothetical protein